jgi:hypothetical protein
MKTQEEILEHIEFVKETYSKLSREHCKLIDDIRHMEEKKIKMQKQLSSKQKYIAQLYKNVEETHKIVVITEYEYNVLNRNQ